MTTEASAILVACDRVLGEIGRRDHMFGWLRVHDSDPPRWLSVDAYYPGNRLIVLCGSGSDDLTRQCVESAPRHGLRLLDLAPEELGDDPAGLDAALARRLDELAPITRPSGDLEERDSGARAASLLPQPATPPIVRPRVGESRAAAAARGARFVSTHEPPAPVVVLGPAASTARGSRGAPTARASRAAPTARASRAAPSAGVSRGAPPPLDPSSAVRPSAAAIASAPSAPNLKAPDLLIGLALIPIVCLELYYGVARFALGGGHVLLAFALALDCCARVLGTVAARRARQSDWLWSCALIGSPAVAMFALYGGDGEPPPEPGILAGLVSLCACAAVVAAVLLAVL